jgi:hypothetical protein
LDTAKVMSLLGMSLIVKGSGFVFGGIISWRRESQTDPPESENTGELRAFVDSLNMPKAKEGKRKIRRSVYRVANGNTVLKWPQSGPNPETSSMSEPRAHLGRIAILWRGDEAAPTSASMRNRWKKRGTQSQQIDPKGWNDFV